METLEGLLFLQLQYASAPLVQNDTPTESSAFTLQQTFTVVFNESHKFTGKPYSSSIGLYYYGARWYDPEVGRFISQDPKPGRISRPQSLNPYTYVVNSPLNYVDPWGEAECAWYDMICHGSNAVEATSNWWNSLDTKTQVAIIAVVATVAIVATAGLAAPAILPLVATGIAIGAGSSVAANVATTIASGGSITAEGLFTSAAIGGFFGALTFGTYGAAAGMAAGAGLGALASSAVGVIAAFGASTAITNLLGIHSEDTRSLGAYVTEMSVSANSQYSRSPYRDTPACRLAITAIGVSPFVFSIGGIVSWAGEEGPIHKVGVGIEIGAVGMLAFGTALAFTSC